MPGILKKDNQDRQLFSNVLFLVLAIFLVRLWGRSSFSGEYDLILTSLIVFTYFAYRIFLGSKGKNAGFGFDTIILTVIILLILSSTGGLNSSFFFLLYFLLFAAAFFLSPVVLFALTFSLIAYFTYELNSLHGGLQLLSLFLIAPLAVFFSKQYLRLLESQNKIKILKTKESKLEKTVLKEETDSLLWLSLNFRENLLNIIHETSELLSDIGHLTLTQKEKLEKVHDNAKELLGSGKKLQENIDKETD
ncbi:hypothetical protein KKA69_01615 [Patescibacteria group bacterium]|nr:hypothetical protein [Patescibacteria group bacterium]